MPYRYEEQRANLFTEEGQRMFLKVRDAGAVRMDKLMGYAGGGDSWDMLACADRLVELGELVEVPNTVCRAGQDRIFVSVTE